MGNYLLRWYSNGDHSEETFTDQATVLVRISELAVSGKECELYEQIPIKLRVTASLPRRYRNGSPAAQPTNGRPPAVPAAEPAGDVFDAGSGQSREAATPNVGSEDPAASNTGLTEVAAAGGAERQLTPQKPAAAPEGVSAAPIPKWGRLAADGERAAWHLWYPGDAEAVCTETAIESPVLHDEPTNRALVCLDCAESEHPLARAYREKCEAEDRAAKEPQRELGIEPTHLCEHENESAGVPCRAIATAGKVNGRWSCKRHSRRTSDAPQVPEATP